MKNSETSQLCPYCGYDCVDLAQADWLSEMTDPFNGDMEAELPCACPNCGRPLMAKARIWSFLWDFYVEPDGEAAKRELELYEKRMRGDWS